jgi:hypothetical protein
MSPEQLYRGWMEARKEAYTWPSILSRVWKNPGRRFTNLAYNVLRKGPNDRLKAFNAAEYPICTPLEESIQNDATDGQHPGHEHAR